MVRQLTNYKGHSHHLYFTNPGWYDNNRKLLFGSDRNNRTNLFGLDLISGEITQLTDLAPVPPPHETSFLYTSVNPVRDEAYFWVGTQMMALDLLTYAMRPLWEVPPGFVYTMSNCTADGNFVCTSIYEDLSQKLQIDLLRGYIGFEETWAERPLSKIIRIAVDGSGGEVVWEENSWIGHVNTSPTQPKLLTFCHEGPWDKVDNRIWGLDHTSGSVWQIRTRGDDGASVGHEHWYADGIHIGYHGRFPSGKQFFGRIRYDDSERLEIDTPNTGPYKQTKDHTHLAANHIAHYHANDLSMIVGDAGTSVHLWRWNGQTFERPRVLCEHFSSMHIQQLHVHPRFTPDSKQILFTSDKSGYGNLYLATIPDFDTLPSLD
jgi:oligogalacturonide lyase